MSETVSHFTIMVAGGHYDAACKIHDKARERFNGPSSSITLEKDVSMFFGNDRPTVEEVRGFFNEVSAEHGDLITSAYGTRHDEGELEKFREAEQSMRRARVELGKATDITFK